MAFPNVATAVTDAFNRADGAPGASYTTPAWGGANACVILTNQIKSNTGIADLAYNSVLTTPIEVIWQIPTLQAANSFYFAILSATNDANATGYLLRLRNTGTWQWQTQRQDAGSSTILNGDTAQAISDGDYVGIEYITGTGVFATYHSSDGSSFTQITTTTESTYAAGDKYAVCEIPDTTMRLDNFRAQTVGAAATAVPVFMNQYRQRWR